MPTSGKSTVGVILAKILGMDFVDTDLLIQKQSGKKLKEILAEDGLEAFLEIEEKACLSVDTECAVIATGGSAVYGRKAMDHFRQIGRIVYLDIDYEMLSGRLHNVRNRGVVLREGQSIRDLYEERVPLYEAYADLTVSERGRDMEETVQAVLQQMILTEDQGRTAKRYAFGEDLGGTTVKIGLFETEGQMLEAWEIPTRTENQGNEILPDIAKAILDKLSERKRSCRTSVQQPLLRLLKSTFQNGQVSYFLIVQCQIERLIEQNTLLMHLFPVLLLPEAYKPVFQAAAVFLLRRPAWLK